MKDSASWIRSQWWVLQEATVHKKWCTFIFHQSDPSLKLVITLGVSDARRLELSKMIRIQLLASISLTLPRMWLWLREVCVRRACARQHQRGGVCYFWEPCLVLTFKATGNGKWFAILETHAEVRRFWRRRSFLAARGLAEIDNNWKKHELTFKTLSS